jgi:hypothetical protein
MGCPPIAGTRWPCRCRPPTAADRPPPPGCRGPSCVEYRGSAHLHHLIGDPDGHGDDDGVAHGVAGAASAAGYPTRCGRLGCCGRSRQPRRRAVLVPAVAQQPAAAAPPPPPPPRAFRWPAGAGRRAWVRARGMIHAGRWPLGGEKPAQRPPSRTRRRSAIPTATSPTPCGWGWCCHHHGPPGAPPAAAHARSAAAPLAGGASGWMGSAADRVAAAAAERASAPRGAGVPACAAVHAAHPL